MRKRNVTMEAGSQKCYGLDLKMEEGTIAKECEWPLDTQRDKGANSFLELPERDAALGNTLFLAQ